MAGRPKAVGMEYFCLNTDTTEDIKIQKLILNCGLTGYGAYIYLLGKIYKEENATLDCNDKDTLKLIAYGMGIKPMKLDEIIIKCVEINLFDAFKWENRQLTSNGIQKRAAIVEQEREKRTQRYSQFVGNLSPTNTRQIPDKLLTNGGQIPDKCTKDKDKVIDEEDDDDNKRTHAYEESKINTLFTLVKSNENYVEFHDWGFITECAKLICQCLTLREIQMLKFADFEKLSGNAYTAKASKSPVQYLRKCYENLQKNKGEK
jgi:hypothetical protein